ncbi:hypothetical protein Tco_1394124 [Tanacetum coccineum]
MFEPHVEDKIWRNQQDYKVLDWKLYDSCGVHSLRMQHMQIYMLVEKKYPLAPLTLSIMLEKKLIIDYESEMAYQLLKFIIKQLKNLLDAVRITAAHVCVNAAQLELKILSVVSVSVKKLHGYGHLEEIAVRRVDRQVYKFKEGDFVDLQLNDIEDMLFLVVQHKLFQLEGKSYQKKLNITEPQKTFIGIEFKELYTPSYKLPRAIYEDLNKHKRVIRADELYKFLDEILKTVRDELHYRILDFRLRYNKKMSRRKWTAIDKRNSELMVELIDKKMRERRIIRNLERLVGARELEMHYRLMTRTE